MEEKNEIIRRIRDVAGKDADSRLEFILGEILVALIDIRDVLEKIAP